MSDAQPSAIEPLEIDISHLQIEDGEPVDGIFSERQMRLLTECLYTSWRDSEGKPRVFAAYANVGLFYGLHEPPVVPDVMVVLGIRPQLDLKDKRTLSYFAWEHGKPPEIVIEIVSNKEGGEDTVKMERYARVGVSYYVILDPDLKLSQRLLRIYERHGNEFVPYCDPAWIPQLGLGLVLWEGEYEGYQEVWLRWVDEKRNLLLTGGEARDRAEAAARQARDQTREAQDQAREAQDQAREAQDQAREAQDELSHAQQEAERLRQRLRDLGVEP